ncbi:HAD family hydrolase [Streptomyces sp. NPDC057702]|uniref:HAD family hydrolase n=1 Tax=unclassified Streptomyces TaxID=2593676 RepID=UPI00369E697E
MLWQADRGALRRLPAGRVDDVGAHTPARERPAVLLDFDGPVCELLPSSALPGLAQRFTDFMRSRGLTVPTTPPLLGDPLESLRFAATSGETEVTRALEEMMCAVEADAARVARATAGADRALRDMREAGVPVVVVSNNSAEAVRIYLERARLEGCVVGVMGRVFAQPLTMKPHPAPVLRGLSLLGAEADACVLIGDSLNDVRAATAAGVCCVGYAADGGRSLLAAGAREVISHMDDALRAAIAHTRA